MQIEALQLFCDLVELKNFSRTAEKNFISQSAVSQQVAQIETELKCQLLDRKKRPFELTEAGKIFYQSCKTILSSFNKCKSELTMTASVSNGQTKIAAIFSIGMHILQDYIKEFMAQYPSHKISLEFISSDKIYKGLANGQIDIGVVAIAKIDRHLEVYDFIDEELVLVCGTNHRLAGRKAISIHELDMEKFISFDKAVPSRGLIDAILKRYNVVVNTVMEFDNTETIKRAVEINAGISILPQSTVKSEKQANRLWTCRFNDEKFTRPASIIIRKNKVLSEQTKFLIELLTGKTLDTNNQ